MKKIIIDGNRVLAAGDTVLLFADHGIINPGPADEAGNIYEGERLLYINDRMQMRAVDALPDPWIPGAYNFVDGKFVLDGGSEAWRDYQDRQAEKFSEQVKQYDGIVQSRIDRAAQEMGYGDPNRPDMSPILHAITYAEEPAVKKFQAEGQLLRAWRSRYWAACWPILADVRDGKRPIPSPESLIAELDQAAPPPTPGDVNAKIAELSA